MDNEQNKVEVDYEGMGTCINADIKVNGKSVLCIAASLPEHNAVTLQCVKLVKRALKLKYQIEGDL